MINILYRLLYNKFGNSVKVQKYYSGASYEFLASNYAEIGKNVMLIVENGFEPDTSYEAGAHPASATIWNFSIFVIEGVHNDGKRLITHKEIMALADTYNDDDSIFTIKPIAGTALPIDKDYIVYEYRLTVYDYS